MHVAMRLMIALLLVVVVMLMITINMIENES